MCLYLILDSVNNNVQVYLGLMETVFKVYMTLGVVL